MKKKFLAVIAVILVAVCLAITVSASLMWNLTSWYTHDIIFAGTEGEVLSEIRTDNSQCSIDGTVTLYRKVVFLWIKVDSWSKTTTGRSWFIQEPFTGTIGTKYKAVLSATVSLNGTSDKISDEVEMTCN